MEKSTIIRSCFHSVSQSLHLLKQYSFVSLTTTNVQAVTESLYWLNLWDIWSCFVVNWSCALNWLVEIQPGCVVLVVHTGAPPALKKYSYFKLLKGNLSHYSVTEDRLINQMDAKEFLFLGLSFHSHPHRSALIIPFQSYFHKVNHSVSDSAGLLQK